ncbi:hypothetical protein AADM20_17150, partial [Erwinia amylovora]
MFILRNQNEATICSSLSNTCTRAFGFVSTAPRHICLANLALLQLDAPVQLIGGDDIARTKPFPDPYLEMLIERQLLQQEQPAAAEDKLSAV